MPALQVRDFPDDLYEKLKLLAQREHRSIAQQTIASVQRDIERENSPRSREREKSSMEQNLARRRKVIEAIESEPPVVIPEGVPTPQQMIREMRDER